MTSKVLAVPTHLAQPALDLEILTTKSTIAESSSSQTISSQGPESSGTTTTGLETQMDIDDLKQCLLCDSLFRTTEQLKVKLIEHELHLVLHF